MKFFGQGIKTEAFIFVFVLYFDHGCGGVFEMPETDSHIDVGRSLVRKTANVFYSIRFEDFCCACPA